MTQEKIRQRFLPMEKNLSPKAIDTQLMKMFQEP